MGWFSLRAFLDVWARAFAIIGRHRVWQGMRPAPRFARSRLSRPTGQGRLWGRYSLRALLDVWPLPSPSSVAIATTKNSPNPRFAGPSTSSGPRFRRGGGLAPSPSSQPFGLIGQGLFAGIPNLPSVARAGWVIPLRPRWTRQLHPQTRTASPPALRNMRGLLIIFEKGP
jgi:hypothetical protein